MEQVIWSPVNDNGFLLFIKCGNEKYHMTIKSLCDNLIFIIFVINSAIFSVFYIDKYRVLKI
jgi:hypothetical protein